MHGEGPYHEVIIRFDLHLPSEYPFRAPVIKLRTRVKHPLVHEADGLFHHSAQNMTNALVQFAASWDERAFLRMIPNWTEVKEGYAHLVQNEGEVIKFTNLTLEEQAKVFDSISKKK